MLGSGSGGNAALLAGGERGVLLDAGLSCRQLTRRLAQVDFAPERVEAIVLTHAHGDHTQGAALFSRRYGVPVYTTEAVYREWGGLDSEAWRPLQAGQPETICRWRFQAFAISHDASETLAYRVDTPDGPIGLATDIGEVTVDLIARFRDCRVLVLESNYAARLLEVSPYHRDARARIASRQGHLSNEALAGFVRNHLGAEVRCLVLAHLSRVNNVPELAEMTCREALAACGREDVQIVVASQDHVAQTVNLGAWPPPPRAQGLLPFAPPGPPPVLPDTMQAPS